MKEQEYKELHDKAQAMVREAHEAYMRAFSSLILLEVWQKAAAVLGPKLQ